MNLVPAKVFGLQICLTQGRFFFPDLMELTSTLEVDLALGLETMETSYRWQQANAFERKLQMEKCAIK